MDGRVFLGRAWGRAYPSRQLPRIRCQVLRTLLRSGGAEGEEAVGLQPQELRPGRPDPAGRGGPRSPWRSTVAIVVAETSMPSFRSSPLILR